MEEMSHGLRGSWGRGLGGAALTLAVLDVHRQMALGRGFCVLPSLYCPLLQYSRLSKEHSRAAHLLRGNRDVSHRMHCKEAGRKYAIFVI